MSAYIVEDKTIGRIVSRLVYEVINNPSSNTLRQGLSKLGYDLTTDSFAEKLAKDMFALNVNAVRQRYNANDPAPKFTYVESYPTSLIQTLKSLNCWVYQCTEGDVPKSSLYKYFVDVFENYLLRKIIYDLPGYNRAEWA